MHDTYSQPFEPDIYYADRALAVFARFVSVPSLASGSAAARQLKDSQDVFVVARCLLSLISRSLA